MQNRNIAFLQNVIFISLSGGRYEILTQKFEFGPEDFLAYIGGYLVSNIINMLQDSRTAVYFYL